MMEYEYRGAPAGNTRFLGIMDTVAAVGTVTNGLDPHSADTGNVTLRLRPGVAQRCFILPPRTSAATTSPLTAWPPARPELALPGVRTPISAAAICRNYAKTSFSPVRRWKPLPQNQPGAQSHIYAQTMAQLRVSNIHRLSCPLYAPMRSPRRSGRTRGHLLTVTPSHKTHLYRPDVAPADGLFLTGRRWRCG